MPKISSTRSWRNLAAAAPLLW